MAKAVRRQTAAQKVATVFGGALVILLVVFGVMMFIQGNQKTVSDSPMQRLISAPTADLFFAWDTSQVVDGVMYVTGNFMGVPRVTPETADEWQKHTEKVADVIAKELKGLSGITALDLKQYHNGELVGEARVAVK